MLKLQYEGDPEDIEMRDIWLGTYADQIRWETIAGIKEALEHNYDKINVVEIHASKKLEKEVEEQGGVPHCLVLDLKRDNFSTWLRENKEWFVKGEHFEVVMQIEDMLQQLDGTV